MVSLLLVLLPLLTGVVHAVNDWNTPCFNGECSWDLPVTNSDGTPGGSGTMVVQGASNAITDISTASGWMILDCDPNAMAQDIRMVCNSTAIANNSCAHLLIGGAEGKLVRLPPTCGKMPFAMIAKSWVHANQSIPASMKSKIARRDGATPTVQGLSVDMEFPTTPQFGNVSLFIQGATIPGDSGNFTQTPPSTTSQRRSRFSHTRKRSIFGSLKGLDSFSKNLSTTLPAINVNKDFTLLNANVDCSSSAGGASAGISANIKSDLLAQAHAVVSIGAVANGTILPPAIKDFALFANLNADIDSTLTINGTASGSLDSGVKTVFEVGIPGLDFPGIFTLGPSFKVNAQATATLDLDIDMAVNLAYKVTNGQLIFPPNAQLPGGGNFAPSDAPLQISVSPNVQAEAKLEAHVIPTIDIGMDAFGGKAQASVFLNLDASATLDLTVNAGGSATAVNTTSNATAAATSTGKSASKSTSVATNATAVNTTKNKTAAAAPTRISTSNSTSATTGSATAITTTSNATATTAPKGISVSNSTSSAANGTAKGTSQSNISNSTSTQKQTVAETSTTATTETKATAAPDPPAGKAKRDITANGCVNLQGGLSVNAGASGSFFSFFSAATQVSLFNKQFQLFNKCFGSSAASSPAAKITNRSLPQNKLLQARGGLSCLSSSTPPASSLVNQLLSGASILPI